ncbi:MAG: competence/damage-inducible protein A [Acidobacteriota bacterium]
MNGAGAASASRRAEIIAVGSELLVPPRQDTNSLFITERLNDIGVEVGSRTIVGDDGASLASVLRGALERAGIVVLCGGLGPTQDDLTRDVVAEVLGRPLEEDLAVLASIRQRFAARGARMPEINRRQAMVPKGASVMMNPSGTAPGLWIEDGGRLVVLLPGPPSELQPMFERAVSERLGPSAGAERLHRRTIRICGRTESEVDEAASPIYRRWLSLDPPITTTVLTAPGQVELHLVVRVADAETAQAILDRATAEMQRIFGEDVFSADGRTLERVVGDLLRERGWTIAVAESCTGGLLSARLTDVPGSSDYVSFNVVVYSNAAKIRELGVPVDVLAAGGAVSEEVACAMADGVRRRAGADLAVGVTGIAGPGGGSEAKPVGTTCIAVVTRDARLVRTFRFPGVRTRVRLFGAQLGLDLARRIMIGCSPGGAFEIAGTRSPAADAR